jgi:signal transduction histidine kinase/ligand-binding sensor domain-containing protein
MLPPFSGPAFTMRRRLIAACVAVLSGVLPLRAEADTRSVYDDYTLTSWTDEDGLFGGWIVGLAQDANGYLWVGTVSGLLRFDGLRFERFQPRDGDRFPQRSVSSVYAGRDGSVWVGFSGSGGVCRIRNGRVSDFGVEHGLGESRVTALLEDADGVMLAATGDGLFRFLDGRWERFTDAHGLDGGPVHSLFLDRSGTIWAASADAVFRRSRLAEHFTRLAATVHRPQSFSEGPPGTMWTTDPRQGYTNLGQAAAANGPRGRMGAGYRLLHDHRGNLWVATLGRGLWFVGADAGTPQLVGTHNGLSNNSVRVLFEDRNGDVWVGTTVGLHRFARRRVTPITDLGLVTGIEADRDGAIWVGTSSGLLRLAGDQRQHFGLNEGLPNLQVRALHRDGSGAIWIGTEAGVAVVRGGQLSALPLQAGEWPSGVMAIAGAPDGSVWICTQDHGLFRWAEGRLDPVDLRDHGQSSESVFADSRGRLWLVLAGGGLGVLENGTLTVLRQGDRFHRSDLAFYEDANGAVWFGAGGRLTRYQDGQLSAITTANGLPPDTIRAIVGDGQGNLWIGTSGGILRLAARQFDSVIGDRAARLDFRAYNSSDGLAGAPVRSGYPNATRGADGRLWFVTGNGVTVLDPRQLSATRPAPVVRVERITAGGRSYDPAERFTLPARTTHLQIEYTAVEFFSPLQVQFRYRLEGFDDEWVDVGPRRLVSFTNLPPRDYRFRVIARSSEGVWNDHGSAIDFTLAPTFYQTRAFAAAGVIGVLSVVFAGWQLRLRQVRRQFGLVLTERARMARELHDTLLQSLAGLELQVDAISSQLDTGPGRVKQQLDRVRRQIQRDVTEARQSIWDLRSPSLQSRDLATALEQLGEVVTASSPARFEFVMTGVPQRCSPKLEEHLLRVGREAVSNAARHAQASVVRLELAYAPDTITLSVSDDGRGFDVQEAARLADGHWGVATMQERAEAIGGRLRVVSRPGAGTHLEMVAPLLAR